MKTDRPINNCISDFEHPDNQWRAIYENKSGRWMAEDGEWVDDIYKAHRFSLSINFRTAKEAAELCLAEMNNTYIYINCAMSIKILTLKAD